MNDTPRTPTPCTECGAEPGKHVTGCKIGWDAAKPAPAAAPQHARYDGRWYFCWLIERRDHAQPLWFTADCTWTMNADEAMWHARKADADTCAGEMFDIDVVVCEHGFDLGSAADSPRWIPWGPGDPLPPHGWYWTTKRNPRTGAWEPEECYRGDPDEVWKTGWNSAWPVVAYFSVPLPEPYGALKAAKLEALASASEGR